jgi:DNA (cytosine-5)-methyltransferase 1
MTNAREHPDLIGPTRELLTQIGLPYVIENVPGAPLVNPVKLCGSSFGLGVPELNRQLRRHRYFETNWPLGLVPPCAHKPGTVGIYGDHLRLGRRSRLGEFSGKTALAYGSQAMGIDWMSWNELREAIPPAYTELVGSRLIDHLNERSGT